MEFDFKKQGDVHIHPETFALLIIGVIDSTYLLSKLLANIYAEPLDYRPLTDPNIDRVINIFQDAQKKLSIRNKLEYPTLRFFEYENIVQLQNKLKLEVSNSQLLPNLDKFDSANEFYVKLEKYLTESKTSLDSIKPNLSHFISNLDVAKTIAIGEFFNDFFACVQLHAKERILSISKWIKFLDKFVNPIDKEIFPPQLRPIVWKKTDCSHSNGLKEQHINEFIESLPKLVQLQIRAKLYIDENNIVDSHSNLPKPTWFSPRGLSP